jgi:hypothetical protein
MLGTKSIYLKVSKENDHRKPELAKGVMGAVYMYLACALISGIIWYRAAKRNSDEAAMISGKDRRLVD